MLFRLLGKVLTKVTTYVLLATTCSLMSCSSKTDVSTTQSVLRINLADDPLSWDPRCVRLIRDITLTSHLFEGLTRHGSSSIENGLAENIVVSEDHKIYTVYLKNTFWSNGDQITAHDVKESWLQVLDPNFPSFYTYFLDIIKNGKAIRNNMCEKTDFGVTVISEKVLSVELEQPNFYFKELLAFPVLFPVHESLRKAFDTPSSLKKDQSPTLISSGAFNLHLWEPKFSIKFIKNPYYWENEKVHLKQIDMSVIADNATEVLLFEKGLLDWLGQPWSSSILSEARDNLLNKNILRSYDVNGTVWLLVNTEIFPLNNLKLRQALSLAVDKKAIIQHILKGNQAKADSVLPKSLSSLTENIVNRQLNLNLAKTLYKEALGELHLTEDRLPAITIMYPSSTSTSRNLAIVQEIQQQWKKHLGLSVNIQGYEYKFFLEQRNKGLYHIAVADWLADYTDPLAFLQILSDGHTSPRYVQWSHPLFSQLIDDVQKEINEEKRYELIKEAEHILLQEVPVLPLYHHVFDYALAKNVHNIIFHPSGAVDLKYATIK